MKPVTSVAVCLALCWCAPVAVLADWSDNFDGYSNGTSLNNVGGWFGWDNVPAAAGVVTNAQSLSAPHSVRISGSSDAVHPFTGYTTGQWILSGWHYIPSGMTTDTYWIVNNEYNHGGPYQWTIQLQFDVTTGTVLDDNRAEANVVPIVFNSWREVRSVIDLDANTVSNYYNGTLVSTDAYTILGGPAVIANLDLFTLGTTSFWDDISLTPEPATCLLLLLGAGSLIRRRR